MTVNFCSCSPGFKIFGAEHGMTRPHTLRVMPKLQFFIPCSTTIPAEGVIVLGVFLFCLVFYIFGGRVFSMTIIALVGYETIIATWNFCDISLFRNFGVRIFRDTYIPRSCENFSWMMGYEPYYTMLYKYGKGMRDFLGWFYFYFSLVCYILGAFLFHLHLLDMKWL